MKKDAMLPADAGIGSNDPDAQKRTQSTYKSPQVQQSQSMPRDAASAPKPRAGTGRKWPQGF